VIFVRRYFYSDPVDAIAKRLGISVSKVKTSLYRTREELRRVLGEEEVML
jgi:RNA polymerase sigma-70 factor (ECF subfamily)